MIQKIINRELKEQIYEINHAFYHTSPERSDQMKKHFKATDKISKLSKLIPLETKIKIVEEKVNIKS